MQASETAQEAQRAADAVLGEMNEAHEAVSTAEAQLADLRLELSSCVEESVASDSEAR